MASAVPPGYGVPPGSSQPRPQQSQSSSGDPSREMKDKARETKDELKGEARSVIDDAKDTARSKMGEQQRAAATGVGDFARSLREAAHKTSDRNTLAARAAEGAADQLERLSTSLKNQDLDSVVRQAESFARREPMLFLGAAVAAGFIAMRLLKGAAPSTEDVQRRM